MGIDGYATGVGTRQIRMKALVLSSGKPRKRPDLVAQANGMPSGCHHLMWNTIRKRKYLQHKRTDQVHMRRSKCKDRGRGSHQPDRLFKSAKKGRTRHQKRRNRTLVMSLISGINIFLMRKGKDFIGRVRQSWPPTVRDTIWGLGIAVGFAMCIDVGRFVASIPPGGSIGGGLKALHNLWDDKNDARKFIGNGTEPTVIYDVRGRVIATLMLSPTGIGSFLGGGKMNGDNELHGAIFGVPMRSVSDFVWQAIVASEDKRFFKHNGVDIFGLGRAVLSVGRLGGGSTITQQLTKNVALSHSRTLTRKVVELILALSIECKLKKKAILEAYLNSVYWGHGVWGIAGASAIYFRKKPSQITLGEAALLAGILPAPEHLSPFRNPNGALRARNSVLKRMKSAGYISEEVTLKAVQCGLPDSMAQAMIPKADASLQDNANRGGVPFRAPYFVAEVLYQLRQVLNDASLLRKGGLQIHTTLDLALQERAEQIVFEDGRTMRDGQNKGECALVAMEPATGAVRALVGGRSYAKSPYNRAMLAKRQPGSAFKPIVYLAALATGLVTPKTELEDEEVVFKREGDGWTAISIKEKKKAKEEAKQLITKKLKKMEEQYNKEIQKHEKSVEKVKEKLVKMQQQIAQFEETTDESSEKMDKVLIEVSKLEEELWNLNNESPSRDPEMVELQEVMERGSSSEEETDSEEEEENYKPQNYNKKYSGVVTLKQCLSYSLNVPTVKLANLIGVDNVIEMAKNLGIQEQLPYSLSLSLGSCEVTPFEMAHVFNTIAARGICSRPHLIARVTDNNNRTLYKHRATKKVVVAPHICADMHRMLRAAVTHGTGRAATRGWPAVAAAGKTGTSDDYRDAWFAGYTPSLTCVVWVGRDDNSSLPGSGSTLAAPIWAKFMRAAQGSGIPAEKGTSKRKAAKWKTYSGLD